MLGALTEKLQGVFSRLGGKKTLTEDNISEAMQEVRHALLEADVNYGVTKTFIKRVKEKALGQDLIKSVSPGQQFIKIVHDELVLLMGGEEVSLPLSKKRESALDIIMICGLQGSGKTTQCAKLALYLKKHHGKAKPLLAACDLQRPAAIRQLQTLSEQAGVTSFTLEGAKSPLDVAKAALDHAKRGGFDLLIVDTAGRLHVDLPLMEELKAIREVLQPDLIFFVANATTGQDAVNSAAAVNAAVPITGTILTMLDGDTRGGAAISIREVTGKPLLFEGIGEKLVDLQLFHPVSMADRILGMGDTINLVKRAQEHFNEDEARLLEKKLRKSSFTFQDYLAQCEKLEKMGPLKGLLKMLPLPFDAGALDGMEEKMKMVKAIIRSMTKAEMRGLCEIDISRRRRIARGSGTNLDEVNKLLKSFRQTKLALKQTKNRKQLDKLFGGVA